MKVLHTQKNYDVISFTLILITLLASTTFTQTAEHKQGVQVAYEYGLKSKEITLGTSNVVLTPNQWSLFTGFAITITQQELPKDIVEANAFKLGIGFGMMKNLPNNQHIFQLWEAKLIPGYESWTLIDGTKDSQFTFGTYISPRIGFYFDPILISVGPMAVYDFGSELMPYNYGGKVALSFFYN